MKCYYAEQEIHVDATEVTTEKDLPDHVRPITVLV
jgi:hypothetical protein